MLLELTRVPVGCKNQVESAAVAGLEHVVDSQQVLKLYFFFVDNELQLVVVADDRTFVGYLN